MASKKKTPEPVLTIQEILAKAGGNSAIGARMFVEQQRRIRAAEKARAKNPHEAHLDHWGMLTLGSLAHVFDGNTFYPELPSVIVKTIPGVWHLYSDDSQVHALVLSGGRFDEAKPAPDLLDRIQTIRLEGRLMECESPVFCESGCISIANPATAIPDEQCRLPWGYIADLGGDSAVPLFVDDVGGASLITF